MRKLKQKDLKYKVISLILAIILWFYIRGEVEQDGFFYSRFKGTRKVIFSNVPIHILEMPSKGMRSFSIKPEEVTVELSVPEKLRNTFQKKDILAYVKVEGLLSGAYDTVVSINVPAGVKVLSYIEPIQLNINISNNEGMLSGLNYTAPLIETLPQEEDKDG